MIPCNCIYSTTVSKCKPVCLKCLYSTQSPSVYRRESSVLVDWISFCDYKDANGVPCSSIVTQPSITKLFSTSKYSEVARNIYLFFSVKLTRTVAFSARNIYHHQRKKIPQSHESRRCLNFVTCKHSPSAAMRKCGVLCLAILYYICLGDNGLVSFLWRRNPHL